MPAKELSRPCMDCKDAETVFTVRKRQLCSDCYKHFIAFKVHRRMEIYRPGKTQEVRPKILLPLSLGVSSSVLLSIVEAQIQHQLAKPYGKVFFDLHVLVIDPSSINPSSASIDGNYKALLETFQSPAHTRLSIHDIFDYVPDMKEIIHEYAGSQFADDSSLSNEDRLSAFRASISTATSAADLDYVLLTRLVAAVAQKHGCQSVFWGDSDSRLAARALAGVSKGRGASMTWQVSDGMSPWGVRFEFPLRDLYKTELLQYASVCPELSDIVIPDVPLSDNVLTKNLSIDELMIRYVQNQGAKYPGIMSNVARTANKLESSCLEGGASCALCGGPRGNVKGNTGVTATTQSGDSEGSRFCYGCMRSRPDLKC
ncbi:Thiouridylase cytoplasmic subunit 2 [Penicillium waksmanii]|uniref:Thiouridylase cytoplasmic subunit 2 n=1 Tax=Penicillium waksmanii TaxID=69791 RepID=UPI0025499CE3|nr:Thiouridylase cytoplasmic subunit 2 [Penicillium waksmanii]KAJ5973461.1 Thiouridylase cytoplasmic subunit 2 [Penicillium waksmanii]